MNRTRTAVVLVLLLFATSLGPVAAAPPGPSNGFDQAPRIAIISAYSPEMVALKAQMNVEKTVVLNGRSV